MYIVVYGIMINIRNKYGRFPKKNKIVRFCVICGREFKIHPCRARKVGFYKTCSRKCGYELRRRNYKPENHYNWKGGMVALVCLECGEEFEVFPHRLNTAKFCCQECMHKYNSTHRIGEKASNWQGGKIKRNCLYCGEEFEFWKSRGYRKFCSQECGTRYRDIYPSSTLFKKGKEHPNWKGGKVKKYLIEYKEWAKVIYKRDNYRCQICNNTSTRKNPIQAHHIYPKRDYPELTYDKDNGITLCRKCHITVYNHEEQYIEFFLMLQNEGVIQEW